MHLSVIFYIQNKCTEKFNNTGSQHLHCVHPSSNNTLGTLEPCQHILVTHILFLTVCLSTKDPTCVRKHTYSTSNNGGNCSPLTAIWRFNLKTSWNITGRYKQLTYLALIDLEWRCSLGELWGEIHIYHLIPVIHMIKTRWSKDWSDLNLSIKTENHQLYIP